MIAKPGGRLSKKNGPHACFSRQSPIPGRSSPSRGDPGAIFPAGKGFSIGTSSSRGACRMGA
ncbi:MAG: hypothetical protein C6W57_08290 [Caldibacillus debilis]|nr:MAG: hypothetical protein C6W57_08290 [Caldibacillus debilis]